jgi:formate--tetrahydrofolate ligase
MSILAPISEVTSSLGIAPAHVLNYGTDKAKIHTRAIAEGRHQGKLILVSAITPTPAGEGKTTVSIGLAQGLKKIGQSVALALRQPSMGPVFGRKGGATGGGKSSITPAHSINLHFTGDFHAVTSAHNLLSSVVDNALYHNTTRLDPSRVLWKRVLDCNDRGLRSLKINRGKGKKEFSTGFDITAASEVMAVLCLAESMGDLRARLSRMVVGFDKAGNAVLASEFRCIGAMMALLKDALQPNLVQSLEGVPAFIHGGPFANIAHGCNSVLATRMAMAYADYAVTEGGFAFDLGGEKFLHIKCRQSGLAPAAIVIVATVRALKMHGGVALDQLGQTDLAAVERGLENLAAHLDAAQKFARPVIVAINRFTNDTEEEMAAVHAYCASRGVPSATADVFGQGGAGTTELAEKVASACANSEEAPALPALYDLNQPVPEKIRAIATGIYGAAGVVLTPEAEEKLAALVKAGYGALPLCMAKTQNSLSDDPTKQGRPRGFTVTVRDFEIAAGAGFLVALTGQMMRMPALPVVPAAERIDIGADDAITGM